MSKASSMIIDNATQRAIEQGKIDLRYASPVLQQVALEIRNTHHSRGGGFLSSLFGRNSQEDDDFALLKAQEAVREAESKQSEREHQRWLKEHPRSPSAPRDWSLLTDNDKGIQSYSDGSRIHYFKDGREMNSKEEYEELNRRYGSV